MKNILLSFILLCYSLSFSAQNVENYGLFPQYKEMYADQILFKEDNNRNIIMEDVVECEFSRDSILTDLKGWLAGLKRVDVDDMSSRLNSFSCEIEISVGDQFVKIPGGGIFRRDKSQIIFTLRVVALDKKYRYTLSDFCTERRRIPGEAKEKGQSNEIHFQRLNSLEEEIKATRRKSSKEELSQMIESEKLQYQAEYDAVQLFIKEMKESVGNLITF